MPTLRAPTICLALSYLALLVSCSKFDRANQARSDEVKKLANETFQQAAEFNRCLRDDCTRQEAGFAYAKKNGMADPDGCSGKGDEDFVEGCRQYGEDIDAAYRRIAGEA